MFRAFPLLALDLPLMEAPKDPILLVNVPPS